MAGCNILDLRCIFVNEIFGSIVLTVLGVAIIYFMIAGKLRWGGALTITAAFPIMIIGSLMIGGFQIVYAFATIIVALMAAFIFQRITGNR